MCPHSLYVPLIYLTLDQYWRNAFNRRLTTIRENYANLGDIFREYQVAVNLEHLKRSRDAEQK